MSGTTNLQNVLANIIRPVHVYDPATSNYSTKVVISNVDTFSVNTIEVENLEFGDGLGNVYLGIDAGSENATSARNVALGVGAAQNNINTTDSVFLGYQAGGQDIRDVSGTIAIGSSSRAGGSSNVYIGVGTGSSNSNATGNIFLGPLITAGAVSNQLRIGRGSTIPISANITSGFVGVNTLDAAYPLDVSGSATTTAQFRNTSGQASVRVTGGGGADATGLSLYQTASAQGLSSSNALPLTLSTANTGRLTILSNGAVGIGTTTPTQVLDVGGTTQTTNAIVGGFLRNALTPSQFDLSSGTLFLSNRVLTGAGTAAAPAYTFSGDTAMGLFDPATNVLGVATAGLERLRVTSNGFVGIGTTAPEFLLDVSGSVRATNFVGTTGSATFGGVLLSNGAAAVGSGSVSVPTVTFQTDLSLGLFRTGANQLGFVSAGLPRMTLSNGNLGIGTTTPATVLDISGGLRVVRDGSTSLTNYGVGVDTLVLQHPGNYTNTAGSGDRGRSASLLFTNSTGNYPQARIVSEMSAGSNVGGFLSTLIFQTGEGISLVERMRIHSNGNLGIGTAAPAAVLDVAGGGTNQMIVRNNSDQAGIIVAGAGASTENGIQLFHGGGAMGLFTSNQSVPVTFFAGNARRMTILSGGNVGIGTTTPSNRLDVAGNIQLGVNNLDYRQFILGGGNSYGYLYGAFAKHGDGVSLTYNFFNNNSSNTIPNTGLNTSRLFMGSGVIQLFTGGVGVEPTTLGYFQDNIGRVGIGKAPVLNFDVSGTTLTSNLVVPGFLRDSLTPTQFDLSGGNQMITGGLFLNSTDTAKIHFIGDGTRGVLGPRITHSSGFTLNFFSGHTSNGNEGNFTFNRATTTGSAESMRITRLGDVGIGTPTPAARLDVSGAGRFQSDGLALLVSDRNAFVDVVNEIGSYGSLRMNGNFSIFSNGTTNRAFSNVVAYFPSEGNSVNFIRRNNTGFGTTSPGAVVDVSGTGLQIIARNNSGQSSVTVAGVAAPLTDGIQLYHNVSEMGLSTSNQTLPMRFYTANLQRMSILSNGNVGIGAPTPDSRMEVTTSNIQVLALQSTASTSPAPIQTTFQPNLVTTGPSNYTYRFFGVSSNTFGCAGELFTYFGVGNSNNSMRRYIQGAGGATGTTLLANGNYGIGTTAPLSLFQVGINAGVYPNNPLQSNGASIIGPARASPTYAGTADMNGTLFVNSSNTVANTPVANVGGSIALGGQGQDFGGGSLHQTWGRITGVTPTTGFVGCLTFETNNGGALFERMRLTETGRLGIGTPTPVTALHVNPRIVDDSAYAYNAGAAMIVHQTPTSSTVLNDPTPVLYLGRQGTANQSFGAMTAFRLSRFDNNGNASRTRMDITMTNGSFGQDEPTVMTMRSDGRVGIGTTTPAHTLDVNGTTRFQGGVIYALQSI